MTVDDAAYHWIRDGRGAAEGREVLGGYRGIVVADGYKAYETLARDNKALTLAYFWGGSDGLLSRAVTRDGLGHAGPGSPASRNGRVVGGCSSSPVSFAP